SLTAPPRQVSSWSNELFDQDAPSLYSLRPNRIGILHSACRLAQIVSMTQSGYANVMSHRNLYFGPGWTRQIASMVLLWLGLGALVGSLSAPPDGGMVGFVAGALAGMIVLPIFGAVFGLLGGRWWETLLGAACGLTSAILIAFLNGSTTIAPNVSLYLLLG